MHQFISEYSPRMKGDGMLEVVMNVKDRALTQVPQESGVLERLHPAI